MQPMDCNKLTHAKEALMKVVLIQLLDEASILSVTLAHCIAGQSMLCHNSCAVLQTCMCPVLLC